MRAEQSMAKALPQSQGRREGSIEGLRCASLMARPADVQCRRERHCVSTQASFEP